MCSSFITYSLYVNYSSLQINLPDSVTKRFYHSMSTYYISKDGFWIVVTGGYSGYLSATTALPITGSNITMVIELGMIINIHNMWYIIIIMFTGRHTCTCEDTPSLL